MQRTPRDYTSPSPTPKGPGTDFSGRKIPPPRLPRRVPSSSSCAVHPTHHFRPCPSRTSSFRPTDRPSGSFGCPTLLRHRRRPHNPRQDYLPPTLCPTSPDPHSPSLLVDTTPLRRPYHLTPRSLSSKFRTKLRSLVSRETFHLGHSLTTLLPGPPRPVPLPSVDDEESSFLPPVEGAHI